MLPASVYQRSSKTFLNILQSTTNKKKLFIGKLQYWWSKVELASEPGFYRMRVS